MNFYIKVTGWQIPLENYFYFVRQSFCFKFHRSNFLLIKVEGYISKLIAFTIFFMSVNVLV